MGLCGAAEGVAGVYLGAVWGDGVGGGVGVVADSFGSVEGVFCFGGGFGFILHGVFEHDFFGDYAVQLIGVCGIGDWDRGRGWGGGEVV
jgi:hypothetical protein